MDRIQTDVNCSYCKHPGSIHFQAEDTIGWFGFCMIENCECYVEDRNNDEKR